MSLEERARESGSRSGGLTSKELRTMAHDSTPTPRQAPEPAVTYPPGFRGRRGKNWFTLGLMYASYYMCRYNLSIAAPRIMSEFGLSNAGYGLINTGRHWAYSVGQFVNGLFTDKLGGKQAMALGAGLTVILNVLFGLSSYIGAGSVFVLFFLIRTSDGYAQAFGSPGMVKINTSWFTRSERGRFAGIFGLMIQVGQISINALGPVLLLGMPVMILNRQYVIGGDWRWLFYVPPAIVAVITVIMYLVVKNNPEEAGYSIRYGPAETGAAESPEQDLPLRVVFGTIIRKKMVWITACAYFCTGIVRTAQFDWWVVYFDKEWGLDIATSTLVIVTGALLPLMAFLGSLGSGCVSDYVFRGRRAPVAMALYGLESAVILSAALLLSNAHATSPLLASVMMLAISLTCNSTHSILGTAAAMDLGGRKMSGFASGVIDSFQYLGAGVAGWGFGSLIDYTQKTTSWGWNVWFYFMLPFSIAGMLLMGYVWWQTRTKDVVGG